MEENKSDKLNVSDLCFVFNHFLEKGYGDKTVEIVIEDTRSIDGVMTQSCMLEEVFSSEECVSVVLYGKIK